MQAELMLIPLLVLLPLFSGVATLMQPDDRRAVWLWALVFSLATFAISLGVLAYAAWGGPAGDVNWLNSGQFFLQSQGVAWVEVFGLRISFGLDSISLWLVLLTTFLMPLVILGSYSAVTERVREYYMWMLLLEAAMIGTFVATDIIFFYICFEFTLLPLFFLIGIWGGSQRLKAAKVFFLYTFTGSMLTFAGVLYVVWFNASLPVTLFPGAGLWTFDIHTLYLAANEMSFDQQAMVLLALLAGFAVKVPLFPVHTWLPLAHTEAPTGGSVILAGVLLKLGTYGLLRFAIPMCPEACVAYAPYIGMLAVAGILYTGLICWVQKDIKKLIAYSSVSHLGFCVLGLFALSQNEHIGQSGAVMYMINHGFSTGALFLCVGMIYERFHTREFRHMGGLGKVMPMWATFFVFFCLASVGLPGLNGFVGEFLTLMGAFLARQTLGYGFAAAAGVGMIVGAIYILYMVGRVVFGAVKVPAPHHDMNAPESAEPTDAHKHDHVKDLNLREIITLTPLAIGCLVLGLYPMPVLRSLDAPIVRLTTPAAETITNVEAPAPDAPVATHHSRDESEGRNIDAHDEADREANQAKLAAKLSEAMKQQ